MTDLPILRPQRHHENDIVRASKAFRLTPTFAIPILNSPFFILNSLSLTLPHPLIESKQTSTRPKFTDWNFFYTPLKRGKRPQIAAHNTGECDPRLL